MVGRKAGSGDRFVAAVEAIYDTAAAPERWPAALEAIAAIFDDIGANLTYRRDDGRFGAIVSPSLVAGVDDYMREWHRHDIRSMRADERGFFAFRDVVTDEHLVSPEEMASHPFYTEFLARFGLRWSASVNISPDPHIICVVTVQRSAAKAAFTRPEQQLLLRLGRHAENALRLGAQLIDSEMASVGLRETLSRLGTGVFLLDRRGRIVFSNTVGNRFLGDSLTVMNARLTSSSASKRAEFDMSIEAALRGAQGDMIADPKPILLQRVSSDRPLVSYVLPMRSGHREGVEQFLARAHAIVIVVESTGNDPADPAVVRDLLGLTLGEARVAALVASGIPPEEASKRLGIPEQTARTVLQRVFTKTGVDRQSELSALLARIVQPPGH